MKNKFAAQLYTLRNELEKDFPGTLRDLKKMGWPAVQISGLRGHTEAEISAVLKETGLKTAGIHISLAEVNDDLGKVLELAKTFNTKDIIVPSLPKEIQNKLGFQLLKSNLNEIARKIVPMGYTLSYHNHAFEFDTEIEGKSSLEYLLEPSQDNLIFAEIDVYWVKKGGRDPLEFIKPYSHRMPIIHLKDMTNDEEKAFAEVGTGSIDFAPILQWGEQNGIHWYAVEQDVCKRPPMDCLQTSLDNLNKLADQI